MTRYNKSFWAILIVGIVLLGLAVFYVLNPIATDIFINYQKIANKDKELAALQKEKADGVELFKNKDKIKAMYNKISTFLPENLASGDFVTQIEEIAKITNQNQIDITIKTVKQKQTAENEESTTQKPTNKSTTPAQTESKTQLQTINFGLAQTGSFPDLVKFMENMQQMSRLFTLEEISLSVNPNNVLETSIIGTIYYKPSITFQDNYSQLTSEEEKTINSLNHFGSIITPLNSASAGRLDPFLAP